MRAPPAGASRIAFDVSLTAKPSSGTRQDEPSMGVRKQIPTRQKRPGAAAAQARPSQSPPIIRAMIFEALGSWVVPTLSITAAGLFWVMSALDVCSESVAVLGVAGSLLVLSLFASLRQHLFSENEVHRYASLALGCGWGILLFMTFYLHDFPGPPTMSRILRPGGEGMTLPQGTHALVVEGRFVAAQGQGNRLGHYRLEIAPLAGAPWSIEGSFEDSFARQRLGRRGTTVVEIQHTSQRHLVGLAGTANVRLAELDPSLEPEVHIAVYPAMNPWLFPVLGVIGMIGALVLEKWLDGDGSLTMAVCVTFFVVDQYLRWASPHPEFRSLIGAILVGGFIGAPLAAIVWWVIPRRWIVRQH
jgi:hypothetical protein